MATKTAKKAPASKKATAKQNKPAEVVKMIAELKTKNEIGREIQDAMTKKLMTVEQIAAATGHSVSRVTEHVNYEVSKNRSKLNGKKQVVVVSQPVRRGQA